MRKLATLMVAAVLIAGCATQRSSGSTPSPTVTAKSLVIGTDGTSARGLLAEIYAGALRAKGAQASVLKVTGSDAVSLLQVQDGTVSALPVFAGRLLLALSPTAGAESPAQFVQLLGERVKGQASVLQASGVSDDVVYCVTAATAKGGVADIGDIAKLPNAVLVAGSGLADLPDGMPALTQVYRLTFASTQTVESLSDRANALRSGAATVAQFRRSDPQTLEFTILTDSRGVGILDPETVLVGDAVTTSTTALATFNAVQTALTQDDFVALRKSVAAGTSDADAAATWLKAHNLGG
ncbi:MAG: glycine betaine ABC transporter substrate-binding protein [Propionibacteriaceae bacterium]